MSENGLLFESLNTTGRNLDYIEALSLEDLKKAIQSIPSDCKIVTIYMNGSRHVAWVLTSAKLKKVKKEK